MKNIEQLFIRACKSLHPETKVPIDDSMESMIIENIISQEFLLRSVRNMI